MEQPSSGIGGMEMEFIAIAHLLHTRFLYLKNYDFQLTEKLQK